MKKSNRRETHTITQRVSVSSEYNTQHHLRIIRCASSVIPNTELLNNPTRDMIRTIEYGAAWTSRSGWKKQAIHVFILNTYSESSSGSDTMSALRLRRRFSNSMRQRKTTALNRSQTRCGGGLNDGGLHRERC